MIASGVAPVLLDEPKPCWDNLLELDNTGRRRASSSSLF